MAPYVMAREEPMVRPIDSTDSDEVALALAGGQGTRAAGAATIEEPEEGERAAAFDTGKAVRYSWLLSARRRYSHCLLPA